MKMNVNRIGELTTGKTMHDPGGDHRYTHAFASDLMSDVLRLSAGEGTILITGLATVQAIRTAEISGINCVIIGRNKRVTADMVELAQENGIALIATALTLYEVSGILYENGIKPVS